MNVTNGETSGPHENSGEAKSESIELVKEGLVLDREWFLPDCQRTHQDTLVKMGLLAPGKEKKIIGLAGIKYFNAMLADLVIADGWGRDSGNPQGIFDQIHPIIDRKEEIYGDLSEKRINLAREQAQRWGISYEIMPTDTDCRVERVMISNLDVLNDDLRTGPVRFSNYGNGVKTDPRLNLVALLEYAYVSQQQNVESEPVET